MTTPSPDYRGLIERVEKYLAERAKSRQLDQSEIHGMHVGDEREAVLTVEDLRSCIAAIRDLEADRERLTEALKPFAAIGADYPAGGLGADIQQRAPVLMRRFQASDFYRAAKAMRRARALSGGKGTEI